MLALATTVAWHIGGTAELRWLAMPPLTREQLAARRAARRRTPLRRDRRALVSAAIPIAIVAVLALVLGVMGGNASSDTGPLASPVPSPELGPGARPPELVIARAEGVEVHIPVDPEPRHGHGLPRDRRSVGRRDGRLRRTSTSTRRRAATASGPDTAGLDVGAPAGTTVYAPVNGVIASVSDYTLSGRIEGYEVTITPSAAAAGLVLRMTHLDEPATGARPSVGTPVRAGVTPLGRVRDFSGVAAAGARPVHGRRGQPRGHRAGADARRASRSRVRGRTH